MHARLREKFSQLLLQMQRDAEIAEITPLVPEASTRRYYRLHLSDTTAVGFSPSIAPATQLPPRTMVGVHEDAATATTNMPNVIDVQRFLHARRVAVPEIYFSDPASGVMLQQDLGDTSLNQILKDQPDKADLHYQDAILHMLSWQRLRDDGTCPAFKLSFDVEKLMFEFEFFIEHTLLGYYHAEVTDTELYEIRAAFAKIAAGLAAYPNKVFTHRDYHSRNIMVVGGRQYIIDFQDARMGLFQYDLCSLLCDAYAPLSVGRRAHLLDFAFEQGKEIHRQTRAEFDHYWRLSAFQRTVKAMGTFGRQAALGRDDFAAYLTPAWQMLREVSEQDAELRLLADRLRGYTLSSQG
jgi:aminoglycoside/choline kinase family phosphotransferase